MHVFTYVFVTLGILQSQFIEKGFKKAKNSEQNVVLLLPLFTLENVQDWAQNTKLLTYSLKTTVFKIQKLI